MTVDSSETLNILEDAGAIVNEGTERREQYGSPLESFTDIAKMWGVILGIPVEPEQVALCMIGLKISRAKRRYDRDSLVDMAGYARTIEMIQEEKSIQH